MAVTAAVMISVMHADAAVDNDKKEGMKISKKVTLVITNNLV